MYPLATNSSCVRCETSIEERDELDDDIRGLAPVECSRCGEEYKLEKIGTEKITTKQDSCPDGPRYKALGNSMAVPVMHWIGKRIEEVEHG